MTITIPFNDFEALESAFKVYSHQLAAAVIEPVVGNMGVVRPNPGFLERLRALHGAEVIAHDLRTGIALVLAGLAADGETIVSPGYLIDRGHASVAARLTALGADIAEEPVG